MKRPWALCLSIGLACGVGLRAQSSREVAEEDIKQAVVMIEGTLGGVDRYGAGILVGTVGFILAERLMAVPGANPAERSGAIISNWC